MGVMVRDYSERQYAPRERIRPRSERVATSRTPDSNRWLRKITGWVFATAALLGILGSFWLNWNINQGLVALSRERSINERLTNINKHLREKRDALMEQKRIEDAAAKLNLQTPSTKQVRRP